MRKSYMAKVAGKEKRIAFPLAKIATKKAGKGHVPMDCPCQLQLAT